MRGRRKGFSEVPARLRASEGARPTANWPQAQNGAAPPGWLPAGRSEVPGNDLLSPAKDYHRPWMLNGRVRNGNGWDHPGKVTGRRLEYKQVAVEVTEPPLWAWARGKDQCGEAFGC